MITVMITVMIAMMITMMIIVMITVMMTMCEIDYIYTCKQNKKKTIGQTKQKIQ